MAGSVLTFGCDSSPGSRTAIISWSSWKLYVIIAVFFAEAVGGRGPNRHPTMLDNPETVTHDEGDTATLFCSVLNLGNHTVAWRKLPKSSPLTIGTSSFTRDPRFHAEHVPNSSQWNLIIQEVKVEDGGLYECQVSRRKSMLRHRVTLNIRARPAALLPRIEISGENVVKAGSPLVLTCNASLVDVEVEQLSWIKDDRPLILDVNSRYSISTSVTLRGQSSGTISSRLQIQPTRVSDTGIYLCRSNERAQMAGVKVEVQGNYSNKRAELQDAPVGSARVKNNVSPSSNVHNCSNIPRRMPSLVLAMLVLTLSSYHIISKQGDTVT